MAQLSTQLEVKSEDLSHSLEDYLEVLAELTGGAGKPVRAVDVSKELKVSKASVSKAISNLKERGYVEQPYYGDITMTETGYELGARMWKRHNLLYRFLNEILGIDEEQANYEACQIEHDISADSFEKWEAYFNSIGLDSDPKASL